MNPRRKDGEARPTTRLLWLKRVLALGMLCGLLLSVGLWIGPRSYPLSPVSELLPDVPPLLASVWFAGLLALLTAIFVSRRPRWYILAFVISAGLMSLWDQSRWQPWFYQYLFMFAALAVYPWGTGDAKKREAALNTCRLIVASIYFWSGLQKLNASFGQDVFPWLVEPLVALLPGSPEDLLRSTAMAVPFVEASIGLGLLTRFRNVAAVLALCMHVFILFSIGPLGHNWNSVVWPWNIAMMTLVGLLFWRTDDFSARDVLIPRTSLFHTLVLILFAVMPLFSFFGLWDSYLSASLYSGNVKSGTLYVSEAVKKELSDEVPDDALRSAPGADEIDVFSWSMEELNVPPYPETRIYKSVAKHVCSRADRSSGVSLVIAEKPSPLDGSRIAKIYDCSGLKTGEHKILGLR